MYKRKKLLYIALFVGIFSIFSTSVIYADTNSGGFSNATGSAEPVTVVRNINDLENAFNQHKHHIVISGSIYGGSKPKTFTFQDTSWNNTTIEGQNGSNPSLINIQLKFDGEMLPANQSISNIVVKNISFKGNIPDLQKLSGTDIIPGGTGTNYEGVSLRRINNATITHNNFYDMSDDLFSISLSSDNITVSNNHFWFTTQWLNMNPNPNWNWIGDWHDLATERLTMVIGANGGDSYDKTQKLHVTLHDNWFGPNLKGRPLLRGYVHAYNNYFDNSSAPNGNNSSGFSQQQYNALQIGSGSKILSENNNFFKTNNSHLIGLDNKEDGYRFLDLNNIYTGVTGSNAKSNANRNEFVFPYNYKLIDNNKLNKIIPNTAGPFN